MLPHAPPRQLHKIHHTLKIHIHDAVVRLQQLARLRVVDFGEAVGDFADAGVGEGEVDGADGGEEREEDGPGTDVAGVEVDVRGGEGGGGGGEVQDVDGCVVLGEDEGGGVADAGGAAWGWGGEVRGWGSDGEGGVPVMRATLPVRSGMESEVIWREVMLAEGYWGWE